MLSFVEITAFRLESKSCQGFFIRNKFSTNESTRIITGHVIYNPAYTYQFQLKTTKSHPDKPRTVQDIMQVVKGTRKSLQ